MSQKIHIQDLSSKKHKIFITIGIVLIIFSGITWFLEFPSIWYYSLAGLAIGCFFFISSDTFTASNIISVDRYGATIKLIGNKTYGFRFSDIIKIDSSDKGLIIGLKDMDDVKLSRKRYKTESLNSIEQLLKNKITNL